MGADEQEPARIDAREGGDHRLRRSLVFQDVQREFESNGGSRGEILLELCSGS